MNDLKVKLQVNKTEDLYGTHLQGHMPDGTTYRQIVAAFGEPSLDGGCDKVDAQWAGTVNGKVFSIYNYKTGPAYLGSEGGCVGGLTGGDWHIGGNVDTVVADLIACLKPDIMEKITNSITGSCLTIIIGEKVFAVSVKNVHKVVKIQKS